MPDASFDKWIAACDFTFWSHGQHKVMADQFLKAWAQGDALLLDVRTDEEIQYLTLPKALHIPFHDLPSRWQEIPRDRLVATFCSGGERAAVAYAYLHARGLENVRILVGGYSHLSDELLPGKLKNLLPASVS